jgi:hypothetical protein
VNALGFASQQSGAGQLNYNVSKHAPSAALLDKVRALDSLPRLGELRTLDLRGNDIRVRASTSLDRIDITSFPLKSPSTRSSFSSQLELITDIKFPERCDIHRTSVETQSNVESFELE